MKNAIFDLDGTLLDSMHLWEHLGKNYLASQGLPAPHDLAEQLRPLTMRQAAEYLQNHCGVTETLCAIELSCQALVDKAYREELLLKPGAKELLKKLNRRGIGLAIATATVSHLVHPCLERLGILPFFQAIVSCDDVGVGKEQPDVYLEACQRLGSTPEQCWVFEDMPQSLITAQRAGFPVVAVFDSSSVADWPFMKARAERYIYHFDEWLD